MKKKIIILSSVQAMKNTKNDLKKNAFLETAIKFILLFFLFLRPFFDGFSYPSFNFYSNIVFNLILVVCILVFYKKVEFSYAQISFLLFIIMCLSFIPFWEAWTMTIKGFTYLFSLFSVWVLFKTVFREEDFFVVAQVLIFALAIISFYGIYQHFWGLEITRQMLMQNPELMKNISETYLDRISSNRIFSTFVYPNIFAGYILLLYPVVFFSVFLKKNKNYFWQIYNGLILALILPVFAATESMGGWLCFLIVSFLILLFILIPAKRTYLYFCIALFLASIFLIFFSIKTGIFPKLSSLMDRVNYWIAALQIFKNNPAGIGHGNFSQFYLQFKAPGSMEAKYAHNLIFEILVSTGISGLFLFLLSIFLFIKTNVDNFFTSKNYLLKGFIFGMIGFFLHSLVDFDYADAAITTIVFAFAGLVESNSFHRKIKIQGLTKVIGSIIIIMILFASIIDFKKWRVEKILEGIKTGTIKENPIQVLEKAKNIFPEPEIFFIEGEIYRFIFQKTKNIEYTEKAIYAYKKAIEKNSRSPKYHRMLAMILFETGRYQDAEKEFLRLIEIYPTKALYFLEIGIFYEKIGKQDLSRYYIEKAKKLPPTSKDEAIIIQEYKSGKNF